jgi:hypothetical protein
MPWSEVPGREVWLPLPSCPGCGETLPRGTDRCQNCRRPALTSVRLSDYSHWVGRRTADLMLLTLFLGAGALALYLSPILALFPLMLLQQNPTKSHTTPRQSRKPKNPPPSPSSTLKA